MLRGSARRRTDTSRPGDTAAGAREAGFAAVDEHGLFGPLLRLAQPVDIDTWGVQVSAVRRDGLLAIDAHGSLVYNSRAKADAARWVWSLAHVLTHIGLGHADPAHRDGRGSYTPEWRAACCTVVDRFLGALDIPGTPALPPGLGDVDAERLAEQFATDGIPAVLTAPGPAGGSPDLWEDLFTSRGRRRLPAESPWGRTFAVGLEAIDGGRQAQQLALPMCPSGPSSWMRAVEWLASSSPMLGPLADGLEVIEDAEVCRAGNIAVAAVCAASGELYLNPDVSLSDDERRFVVGHQLLHAGLRHDTRGGSREPELYNAAADLVINAWLLEMRVGVMPDGCLHDPQLAGRSVDAVYEQLARNMRRFRRLASAPGLCAADVLGRPVRPAAKPATTLDLDGFYRRALTRGLDLHQRASNDPLPPGLVQEIRALEHA